MEMTTRSDDVGKPHDCGTNSNANAAFSSSVSPTNKRVDPVDDAQNPTPHHQVPTWKKLLSFVGPGFFVSMAYLDPSNLETDLQAGANNTYELLWVILTAMIFGLIIQSLAANLGVCTGKHLSELCRAEYPAIVNYCLWVIAETSVVAADIPEVVGTGFAFKILFHLPIWFGVLFTGFSTLLLLGLHRYGVRKLEMLIATLISVMAACFFGEMSYVKPPAKEVIKGMFVPSFKGHGAIGDSIALLGALVMPHNLFLHSALVLSRKIPNTVHDINEACKFFLLESGFSLFIAFMINLAVVTVAGASCSGNLTPQVQEQCNNLTINSASFLLNNVLGKKSASVIYGIALLASGQSSAISCTYSAQYIMQGFLDVKMKRWKRNIITRSMSITPSLLVSIIGGSAGASRLIIIASMILSFELPFALIPLLKFSTSSTKMGPHKNSIYMIVLSWLLGLGILGINVYYLTTGFMGWLIHSSLPRAANVLISIVVFPLMGFYVVAVLYFIFRKDRVVTFTDPTKVGPNMSDHHLEDGVRQPNNEGLSLNHLHYKEDLVDIPLPESDY